jgi:hypothetical protein
MADSRAHAHWQGSLTGGGAHGSGCASTYAGGR